MNWLGLTATAFIVALVGAVVGGVGYGIALMHGWDVPFVVGLAMGGGAMLASPDKSGLRGLLIASCAIWIAAIVQSRVGPYVGAGLAGFHTTLTPRRLASFSACGVFAFLLAKASARKNAPTRAAGS